MEFAEAGCCIPLGSTHGVMGALSVISARGSLGIGAAIGLWTTAVASAQTAGQVTFVDVASARGLIHANPYGQTFAFTNDQWAGGASMLRLMQRNLGNGAAVVDFDRDGDLDVYLLNQLGIGHKFFRNDLVSGRRQFTDITASLGLGDTGLGRTALFADLDNDGWDDLILINDDEPTATYPVSRIFRNNAGAFEDVTASAGVPPVGHIKGGACLGDYDGDGLVDLYVGVWLLDGGSGDGAFAGYNHLFRNLGGMRFEDVTLVAGLGVFSRDSFSCVFADFDNDGDADLYVAVDHTSDLYYRNDGGTFVDDTLAVEATHTGNDMGLSVFDFDDDGDLDVYSTNITDPALHFGTTQGNTLLINELSETGVMRFVDEAAARGVQDTAWGWGTEFVDVDNDADLDLYAVNGFDQFLSAYNSRLVDTREVLFINNGTGHFSREVGCGADFVGDARAAIAFDFDLDGDQDLLVTAVNEPTVLLENRTAGQGNWLDVRLIGTCGKNTNAIGGRVFLTVGDRTFMREVIAGGSYLSGRPYEQHFGLGVAESADELRVDWPDGTQSSFTNIPANRRVAVEQASDPSAARLIVSRDLHDLARFQRCFGSTQLNRPEAGCDQFDTDGAAGIDIGDGPAFLEALRWTLPGCSTP